MNWLLERLPAMGAAFVYAGLTTGAAMFLTTVLGGDPLHPSISWVFVPLFFAVYGRYRFADAVEREITTIRLILKRNR